MPVVHRAERTEWVIVGGGFAGLAAARALARARLGPGIILEQEAVCGMHASGRNAGSFRLAEHDPPIRALAEQSDRLLGSAHGDAEALVERTGGLTLASEPGAPALAERAAAAERGRPGGTAFDGAAPEALSRAGGSPGRRGDLVPYSSALPDCRAGRAA